MKKTILFTIFTCFTFFANAQVLKKQFHFIFDKNSEVFTIPQPEKNKFSIFINDNDGTRSLLFDESFNIIDSLASEKRSEDFKILVGYSITDKYNLYWANRKANKIQIQSFDYQNKKVFFEDINLTFENERAIVRTTINNQLYIITANKSSNILNFYIFNGKDYVKKEVSCSANKFMGVGNAQISLYEALAGVSVVPNDIPTSLTYTSEKCKMYHYDNRLIFTFDYTKTFTYTLEIDLNNFTTKQDFYAQQFPNTDDLDGISLDSNSFLLPDKIVLLSATPTVINLTIDKLDGELLTKYSIFSDQELPFKNATLFEEKMSSLNKNDLKPNQFVRKIYNRKPSVSCYLENNKLLLTMGSVSEIQNNNAIMYGGLIGGFTGAIIAAAITSNQALNNVSSYANRNVVYMNCMFDSNFSNIPEPVAILPFDKLRLFIDSQKKIAQPTVFKLNNNLYFGNYDKKTEVYSFYEFK